MANPIEYIVFEPDQVLTNDHLNETFNYLDQQNRWTRNKLIGIGIVCGLEIVLNPGIIEVTKGCGVTSQGYLITQDKAQYTYYIPYAAVDVPLDLPFTYPGDLPFYKPFCLNKKVWMLLTDAQYGALDTATQLTAATISSSTTFLLDYDVVLFLEAKETDLKNCDMLDCNNKGEKMGFVVRPLLVAKKDLSVVNVAANEQIAVDKITQAVAKQVELKRFNVPYTDLNNTDDVLNAFLKVVDDATLTQLSSVYNLTYEKYGPLLGIKPNPFAGLLSILQKYRDTILKTDPIFIQYFYDLIDDLIKAWHEFTVKVAGLLTTCCPDENLFPLHLVLGSASQNTSAFVKDPLRNYFIYSALFSKTGNDMAITRLFFMRMVIMVNEFTIQTQALQLQAALRITPSQYEFAWLSERAIPYYYKVNAPGALLYNSWSYAKTAQGNATRNLSYNANQYSTDAAITQPLLYDIERFNFFRVEGHIGKNYQTVLSDILNQRQVYNLPFDVVAVSADQLQSTAALPTCNMLDLETDYKLIVGEAACKIHVVFCFITKLPYKVAASLATRKAATNLFEVPKTSALKFTAFKLDAANLIEIGINLNNVYKKGDFMRKYCAPLPNTIGSGYLNALSATGIFTNPVQIDQGNSLTIVYYYFFEFVNAVEDLMYVLQTSTLANIDMAAFNLKYQTYLADTALAIGILVALTTKKTTNTHSAADTQFVTLAEDTELDLLVEELSLLTNMCIEERLQVLKDEYNARLTQYQQQLTFLNYYKNHPGLEHKAGVPKGGTFVLVYHSVTQANANNPNTFTNAATGFRTNIDMQMAQSDVQVTAQQAVPASVYLDDKTINLISSFVNDCNDAPPAKKQTIINILHRLPHRPPTFTIPDGAIIADFYIPYLCCSDCPPVAYITPAPPPPVQDKPWLKMGDTYCDNDTNPAQIEFSAPGGTLSINGVKQNSLSFVPATEGAGKYTIVYTLNNVDSDPVPVTVLPTPVSTFTYSSTVSNTGGIFTIEATFTPDSQDPTFTYAWKFGPGFPETVSSDEFPNLAIKLDPNNLQFNTTVTLTVSNGTCTQNTITKNVTVSSNGIFEPGAASKIIQGIENLFTKKKKKN